MKKSGRNSIYDVQYNILWDFCQTAGSYRFSWVMLMLLLLIFVVLVQEMEELEGHCIMGLQINKSLAKCSFSLPAGRSSSSLVMGFLLYVAWDAKLRYGTRSASLAEGSAVPITIAEKRRRKRRNQIEK